MKTLYIDCGMGAAGDMLSAALYELLGEEEQKMFLEKINALGIDGVNVEAVKTQKCGIFGTHMKVTVHGEEEGHDHDHHHDEHDHHHEDHDHHHDEHGHHHEDHDHHHEEHHHHHHHASYNDITVMINGMDVDGEVKENAIKVYELIALAESNAHNKPVSDIHFHEVGTKDAVADVLCASLLLSIIKPDKIIASPVCTGSGHVHCAHGILPVPAPATAFILKDVPIYSGDIESELCTPTGAAILKNYVDEFGSMPVMKVAAIGYGMGNKDFKRANCVRVLLGETFEDANKVINLTCNIDDMTPEQISFAMERIYEAGALEVYTTAIGMKKSRPGVLFTVICNENRRDEIISLIFKHTTTIGLREDVSKRYTMARTIDQEDTKFGSVRIKKSRGYGIEKSKYEYEDLAAIARTHNLSINDVLKQI